jgi:putative oxidoreductase
MIDVRFAPFGAFLLRVSLGAMYLAHSLILKYIEFSLPGTAEFFRTVGVPGWIAYATLWAETIGGLLLVIGIWPRAIAVALLSVHIGNGWVFSAPNGGWEYPVFLVIVSMAVALVGDGAFALRPTPLSARRPYRPYYASSCGAGLAS